MNNLEAIIYGVIQGLSEFLPVSSSGHLALLPHVMNIEDPGVKFDLMMHLGTALAIIVYFRTSIWKLVTNIHPRILNKEIDNPEVNFFRHFSVATISSVMLILILLPFSKMAREPWVIVLNLSLFGLFLWLADLYNKRRALPFNPLEKRGNYKYSIIIGLSQSLAIFPGVSRSGVTLTSSLLMGLSRKDAGSFSFLLSLPIIFAGIIKEIPELMKSTDSTNLLPLLLGVFTSFVVGWVTIHFFMKLIAKIPLVTFTVYRWIIAICIYFIIY